jgi:glucosamine--fructose-6-phosphate aminotransferase (isomerizing)
MAVKDIEGSYAIAVIRSGEEKLVVTRRRSPLVVGLIDKEYVIASDATAILDYTDRITHLEEGDICVITTAGLELYRNGSRVPVKEGA